jgi:uncharacterized protein (TIGR03435 family)
MRQRGLKMKRQQLTTALTCGAVLIPALLIAQVPLPDGPPVDPALRFEVASIRPYVDNGPTRFRMQPGGRLDITGGSVRVLLSNAFRVRGSDVIGLPEWGDKDRYSVLAKAPDGAPQGGIPTMLANLLADRFSLVMHRETRETQSFDLVLARDDGKLGPALTPTSVECQAAIATKAPAAAAPPAAGPDRAPCGSMQAAAGIARASGVVLGRLVQMLAQFTGQPVSDKTGLDGLYDFTLTFSPNLNADAAVNADAPHLFTALQEQLGLRLSSQRGTALVVVVDRIEKPTLDAQ